MKRYIFAADADGTILMDNLEVHPETIKACKKAQELNHVVVIATGRAVVRTLPILKKIPYVDYFICNNGAVVYDVKNQKSIYVNGVNPQHYPKILDFARKHNVTFKLHTDQDWIGDIGIEDQAPTILTAELDQKIREHIQNFPNDKKLFNQHIPTQISINGSKEFCKQFFDQFKIWFGHDSSVFIANDIYIDVNAKDISKWTGLLELAKTLNLASDQIVTFGDSSNDLEMLLGAKLNGYAMQNSKADLIKFVKPRIGDNNSDAIAQVIYQYINK